MRGNRGADGERMGTMVAVTWPVKEDAGWCFAR